MITAGLAAYWAAALLLAAAFFSALLAWVFGRVLPGRIARVCLPASLAVLTIWVVLRWIQTGHPPFVTLFESMLASIWFLLLLVQLVPATRRGGPAVIAPVAGAALLLLGWSLTLDRTAGPLSSALQNTWLFIHASFATAGAATFLMGAALSVFFLLGDRRSRRLPGSPRSGLAHGDIPDRVTALLLFGLVLWGVMLVSGSIWADIAWGRYWAWDPVEMWSLISWLLYGLLYHARRTWRMSDRLYCGLNIVAAGAVVFALWCVQYFYETIHTYG